MMFKVIDNTKEFGDFYCQIHFLAFWFEELEYNKAPKFVNPFFHKDERKREIAKIILNESSELVKNPRKHMSFDNGEIEVIMLD